MKNECLIERFLQLNKTKKEPTPPLHRFCCTSIVSCNFKAILAKSLKHSRFLLGSFVSIITTLLVIPSRAWALQTHGAPEGLYVHQMAHILFMAALIYLFWDIRRSSFHGRGWDYLQYFCLMMFLWNFIAFTGHFTHLSMEPTDFHTGDKYIQTYLAGPLTPVKLTYYLAKLDHLISVPALFFLYLALRSFYRTTIQNLEERS